MDDNIAISIGNPPILGKKCSSPNSFGNCHSTCFINAYTGWSPVVTGICVWFRCLISFLMTLIQWATITGELIVSFISGNSVDVDMQTWIALINQAFLMKGRSRYFPFIVTALQGFSCSL